MPFGIAIGIDEIQEIKKPHENMWLFIISGAQKRTRTSTPCGTRT